MGKLLIASSADSNFRYATGLNIPDPAIFFDFDGKQILLVNRLEFSRAKQQVKQGVQVECWDDLTLRRKPVGRKRTLADIAAAYLLEKNITAVDVPKEFWALNLERLREHNIRPRIVDPFFPERRIKTPEELKAIKATGTVTKKALKHALEILKEAKIEWNDTLIWKNTPVTSEFLQNEIEKIFLENDCSSGETIVACGEHTAQPHNRGSGPIYAGKPIILDLFPRSKATGYFFDVTRTVIKGTPSKELKDMYAVVKKAQQEALAVVQPGKAEVIHNTAKEIFDRQNYKTEKEGFIHGTGHGLGLDIHEAPRIGSNSEDKLVAGDVITIEPGLYYKELGGIRIEDTVLVTKDGHINLTNLPKTFVIQ
ncbi:MAG: Xaa-Pro peptidase family protein [Candidatus Woesearchaeota archaeon]|nr:Xaa-Pro peptidase family protein [Candidatus Woesearchaeota archaeon]